MMKTPTGRNPGVLLTASGKNKARGVGEIVRNKVKFISNGIEAGLNNKWAYFNPPINASGMVIEFNNRYIWIQDYGSDAYISDTGCATWQGPYAIGQSATRCARINNQILAYNYNNSGYVTFKYTTNGVDWYSNASLIIGANGWCTGIYNGQVRYVSHCTDTGGETMWSNDGIVWTAGQNIGQAYNAAYYMNGAFYCGTKRSDDGGATWSKVGAPPGTMNYLRPQYFNTDDTPASDKYIVFDEIPEFRLRTRIDIDDSYIIAIVGSTYGSSGGYSDFYGWRNQSIIQKSITLSSQMIVKPYGIFEYSLPNTEQNPTARYNKVTGDIYTQTYTAVGGYKIAISFQPTRATVTY